MELERKSSGVAKAGLTTGIIGTSLGALGALGNGLGGLFGGSQGPVCSEDHLVSRFELSQESKIAELQSQIALRDANTFTDQKLAGISERNEKRFREIEEQICRQAINNQKTVDSFQMMSERMQCCCDSLESKIKAECKERKCADNTIVTYANATFYPKQVADVKTGNEVTPQVLYNPLPVDSCGCGCGH